MMRWRVVYLLGLRARRAFALLWLAALLPVLGQAEVTTYTYDVHGRLKTVTSPSGPDSAVITNIFDNAGNRTSISWFTSDASPPNEPTGLNATVIAWNRIDLAWTGNGDVGSSGMKEYRVYRGGYVVASPTGTTYSDTGLAGNTPYNYRVSAVDNSDNESTQSNLASATTPPEPDWQPPSVPTNLQGAAISGTWVNLTWNGSADNPGGLGLAGYEIFRDGGGSPLGYSTIASYSDQTAVSGATHGYQVRAYDLAVPANYSGLSAAFQVTTPDTVAPGMPGAPTFSDITGTTALATWTAASDNVGVTAYRFSTNGGSSWTTLGSGLSTTISGLALSTNYTMLLQAGDAAGYWSSSSSGSFTTSSFHTDVLSFVGGNSGDGATYLVQGYQTPNLGSLVPNTVTGGQTITIFQAFYDLWYGGSSITLQISGFSGNPGQGWLQSISIPSLGISLTGAGASFGCVNSSICGWTWSFASGNFGGSGQMSIVHQ